MALRIKIRGQYLKCNLDPRLSWSKRGREPEIEVEKSKQIVPDGDMLTSQLCRFEDLVKNDATCSDLS